jgi:hypothetical protein
MSENNKSRKKRKAKQKAKQGMLTQTETLQTIRKVYGFSPVTRFHATPKGKKGFDKKERRQNKIDLRGGE